MQIALTSFFSSGPMVICKVSWKNTRWWYTYLELHLLPPVPISLCARHLRTTAITSRDMSWAQLRRIFYVDDIVLSPYHQLRKLHIMLATCVLCFQEAVLGWQSRLAMIAEFGNYTWGWARQRCKSSRPKQRRPSSWEGSRCSMVCWISHIWFQGGFRAQADQAVRHSFSRQLCILRFLWTSSPVRVAG